MSELIRAIPAGFSAFAATNLDDIVILLLLFSQVNSSLRRQHIVMGQYLGFTILVLLSLPGFWGGLIVPQAWIGMLGIVPIFIGISRLFNQDGDESDDGTGYEAMMLEPTDAPMSGLLSPQVYAVAAITLANGSDNLSIYVPLFASCTWERLAIILSVFFLLVGVWCYVAYRLTDVPTIARTLMHHGNRLVPFILIGLGAMILIDSHTLEDRSLLAITLITSCLCLISVTRQSGLLSQTGEIK
jgi:cadmium resistance transport/sequestration family protein